MKKIFILTTLAVAVLFASCEKEPESPKPIPTTPSFTFSASALSVNKGEQSASFTVKRGGDPFDGTVTLGVSLTGIANPADPAVYTIAPEVVTFNGNYAEGSVVTITTAANDGKVTGDKKFAIKMISASASGVVLSTDSVLVTIKDVNVATVSLASNEPLELKEGGDPIDVVIQRTGADWAGTVTLEAVTAAYTNPALHGEDYLLSETVIAFAAGETSKTVTITPHTSDGAFTGDAQFELNIKSAPGAAIEDGTVEVAIKETDDFTTYFTSSGWQLFGYSDVTDDFLHYDVTITQDAIADSIYHIDIVGTGNPLKVCVHKDYSMSIELPQYLRTDGSSYYRYESFYWGDGDELYGFSDNYTMTASWGNAISGNALSEYVTDVKEAKGFTFAPERGIAIPKYNQPDYIDANRAALADFIEALEEGTISLAKYGY